MDEVLYEDLHIVDACRLLNLGKRLLIAKDLLLVDVLHVLQELLHDHALALGMFRVGHLNLGGLFRSNVFRLFLQPFVSLGVGHLVERPDSVSFGLLHHQSKPLHVLVSFLIGTVGDLNDAGHILSLGL